MIFGCCQEAKNGAVSRIAEAVLGCCFSNFVFNQPGLEIILTFDALEKESLSLVSHFGWSRSGEFFGKSDHTGLKLSGFLESWLEACHFWECWLQFWDCLRDQSGQATKGLEGLGS